MNNILAFTLLLSLGFFTWGCSDSGDNSSIASTDELAGSTYRGVIPCADCEGILYELSLDQGQTYEASSIYIGESNRPFIDKGSWKTQEDTLLVLNANTDSSKAFIMVDTGLKMLDMDQKLISGSIADRYLLRKKSTQADSAKHTWMDLREKGIDFRASGNEPFWGIQINFEKMMTFKILDGDSLATPVPEMQQDTASKARLLNAKTESDSLTLKLYPTGCVDNMSGDVFSHGVNVEYDGETYRGCGNFINDKYQLHDLWMLHSLDGSEVAQDSLMKKPALTFDLQKNRISGNSGCNQLSGKMELEGDRLSFGQLASTKMACQGSMEFENNFLKALGNVTSYNISHGEFRLMGKTDTLMVLRRAE